MSAAIMILLSQIIRLQLLIMSEIDLDCLHLVFPAAVLQGHEKLAILENKILDVLDFFNIKQKPLRFLFACFNSVRQGCYNFYSSVSKTFHCFVYLSPFLIIFFGWDKQVSGIYKTSFLQIQRILASLHRSNVVPTEAGLTS